MKICVLGLGYIGLPTASLLATKGFSVLGVDVKSSTVDTINEGGIHIVEPDLDVLVRSAVQSGQLSASLIPAEADVFILAVPTPLTSEHYPDTTFVEAATRSIAPVLRPGNLVILESTSPVGTTEKVVEWIREARPELASSGSAEGRHEDRLYVAHCPERVLPGHILRELVDNDRVVGGIDRESAARARDFYASFVNGRILLTDSRTAEMCKLAENAFRDVNIAFANELSILCENLGVDVWDLIDLANRHPRVNILRPGPGVGGHCIAVDPWFLIDAGGDDASLMRSARTVNSRMPRAVANKVVQLATDLATPTIACLGLAYKPDVDDLRESPSLEVIKILSQEMDATLLVVEPNVSELPAELALVGAQFAELGLALERSDIVVALVTHREFLQLPVSTWEGKRIVDACGLTRR